MSIFGIRKRLKKLVGLESKPNYVTYSVTYLLPDGSEKTLDVEEKYTLMMASQGLSSPISNGRRAGGTCPDGACGLCRVDVEDGTGLSSLSEFEQKVMNDHVAGTPHEGREREPGPPLKPTSRLACHCRIIGDGGRVRVAKLVDYEALRGTETE